MANGSPDPAVFHSHAISNDSGPGCTCFASTKSGWILSISCHTVTVSTRASLLIRLSASICACLSFPSEAARYWLNQGCIKLVGDI